MKPRKNEYESLIVKEDVEHGVLPKPNIMVVYDSSKESICISTAEAVPGKWVYGYSIQFNDSASHYVTRQLGERTGWFRSEKDARLYFLGHIMQYREYFSDEAIKEVKKSILKLIESQLFN